MNAALMNAASPTPNLSAQTFAQWKNGAVQIWGITEAAGYCRVVLLTQRKSESGHCIDWPHVAANRVSEAEDSASH